MVAYSQMKNERVQRDNSERLVVFSTHLLLMSDGIELLSLTPPRADTE